jgi:hypothetical protein
VPRQGHPTRAADVVRAYLGENEGRSPRGRGRKVLKVFQAFQGLGPPLTRRAEPIWFGDGVLTLRVFGSTWMTELSFMTDEIAERLNRRLGQAWVTSVRLRAGPPAAWGDDAPRRPKLSPAQLERVEALGAEVRRPDVKAAVMRAAAASIARPPPAPPPRRRRRSEPRR